MEWVDYQEQFCRNKCPILLKSNTMYRYALHGSPYTLGFTAYRIGERGTLFTIERTMDLIGELFKADGPVSVLSWTSAPCFRVLSSSDEALACNSELETHFDRVSGLELRRLLQDMLCSGQSLGSLSRLCMLSRVVDCRVLLREACFYGYFVDMTQHYQREKDLQEANTRLELVLEGTQLGMWDWNPQTNEVVFNERWATMLGYSFGEISNSLEEWSSRVHPDDVQQCFRDIELHIQGITGFYENVHRMKHKDGSWHYILDRGKVVERDAEGKAIRFTGTHTDITREKLAELRAIEANKVKTMFLANMSHEIRTPLNGIVGVLDLLSSTRLNDEQKELLSLGTESCTTLSVILNDVLDLSKIDAGKMHIDMTSFNFHRLFDSIASIHSNLAKSKGLDFVADYDESIPEWLVSDRHRIRQILSNLCSNALKFTHKGHIRFGVKLLDRLTDESGSSFVSVQFDIEDSGVGITSDKLDLIFHDFTQSDNSISRRYGGTGLGLSICRKLSALLDGEILVSSKENQGSTFSLKMMLRVGSEEAELSNVLSRDSYRNLKVLVAEDNRINQIMISKILKQFDIVPDIVPNGKEAVHAVLQKQYDIILMDVHMPVMTGIEAAQRISESCVPRSPFVVACTADVIDKSKESFSKYGFHDLVSKPFDSKDIAACLSRFEHHAQRPKRSRASL